MLFLCVNNQVYDENNLNYLNDVSLKIQSDGSDIIEDLLKRCNSLNSVHDNIKPIVQNPKIVGKIMQFFTNLLILKNIVYV